MKNILYTLILVLLSFTTFAQAGGVGINTTGAAPHPSAALDVDYNNKGILFPRLTTNERNNIQTPAVGLIIYNTTTKCVQFYAPSGLWRDLGCDCSTNPLSTFTNSPNTPNPNTTVTFTPSALGQTYSWTFQSGTPATSTVQNPTVSWSAGGTYNVTLTVTDNQGCSSTTTQSITVNTCTYAAGSQTFSYTGSPQTFTVPPCVTSITITAYGAQGYSVPAYSGGLGGSATGTLAVTAGQQLYVYVGGAGQASVGANVIMGAGWNGGGNGMNNSSGTTQCGGGGGGSDVRTIFNANPSDNTSLASRIIVAGGGGGATGNTGCFGGNGGGTVGDAGGYCCGGSQPTGGTQVGGGSLGGGLGQGGNAISSYTPWIGGGGGGYYGGGTSNAHSAGGGGSSYTGGVTAGSTSTGVRSGDGQVVITW